MPQIHYLNKPGLPATTCRRRLHCIIMNVTSVSTWVSSSKTGIPSLPLVVSEAFLMISINEGDDTCHCTLLLLLFLINHQTITPSFIYFLENAMAHVTHSSGESAFSLPSVSLYSPTINSVGWFGLVGLVFGSFGLFGWFGLVYILHLGIFLCLSSSYSIYNLFNNENGNYCAPLPLPLAFCVAFLQSLSLSSSSVLM